MKKTFLSLAISLIMLLILTASVCAAEYTVGSNEEYNAAYEQANSGDTIVINKKLTCDIYADKSITYVLNADWESSKLVVNTPNVEVSFIADGGDYRIMPTNYSTTEGWLHISQAYEGVVINLGGKNGGTVTIDGSNATHDRVTYVEGSAITLNLLDGSAIANFNTTIKDDNEKACILYARTVNMYDGCKIYGNRVISAPLIMSIDFNLYGGEIFGNLLTSTRTKLSGVGFIYAYNQFTMYGGNLSGNVFNATGGASGTINAVGFISVRYGYQGAKMVVYDGVLGNTYVSGNSTTEISAMFGINNTESATSYFYYNSAVNGTRYKFTDTPTLAFDESTEKTVWKVNNYTSLSTGWNGWCYKQTKVSGDRAAVFLDAQKKTIAGNKFDTYTVINAYIGNSAYTSIVYAHSGSKVIAIPSGYSLWSTSKNEYCHTGRAYTLDEVKAANVITLYTAYEAQRVTNDGVTSCQDCGRIFLCNNPQHDRVTLSMIYNSNNYDKEGTMEIECRTCNVTNSFTAPALFTCLGYSAPEDGTSGIAIGYTVNNESLKEFEKVNGITLNYGVFVVLKDKLGTSPIFGDDGTPAKGVVSADITGYDFTGFTLKIVGFTDEHKSAKLAMGAYIATNGKTTSYSYIQGGAIDENEMYHFASYYDVLNLIPDEIVVFEDISIKAGEEVTLPSSVKVNGTVKDVSYSFLGENISIENNILKGLVKGSETIVTVTGKNITGSFKVKIESDNYKHVVVIGVDGAGAFFKNASTPNIDAIFANGAITYDCLTAEPTISAQCWGSLLHGVTPSVHGLTNAVVESTAYPTDSKYPSFFRVIRENNENAVLASFCNWNPINVGIIENNIGVHKVGGISDSSLTNEILAYLESNIPTALFVQFDEADGAGHTYGYGTASQLNKISEIDGYIGQIYEAYRANGMLDETLFIVTSDHGGTGKSHGGLSDNEKYVMFAATGKTVINGTIGDVEIRDTAAIVLHALGYDCPETWTSRVPSDLFEGVTAGERPVYVDKESDRYHETEPTPEIESDEYVTSFIEGHELNTYLTFDGDITDNCGGQTSQGGNLYFIENGYFGNGVSLDDGYVTLNDFKPGSSSFTIALWLNAKSISSDPCIFSNKDWETGNNSGIALAIRSGEIALNLGKGNDRIDCIASLPTDYSEGWMHVLAFVDRENNKIGLCLDFGTIVTIEIPEDMRISMDTQYNTNIGQDGTGEYSKSLPATIDELMIFSGAFDSNDVAALESYYGLTNN